MQKNTASQKWVVFAFQDEGGTNPGEPVTGDAANITANVRIDGGAANAVDDVNPTELEDGYYIFDITAAESNGDLVLIAPVSATANVNVIGVPGAVWTTPPNFPELSIVAGEVTAASVTGAVGSVTGAVGSVTGAVASVTGAVGSVAGNVDGNVTGSTGSVVGAVGSVTGAVGSVTGAVGSVAGNVDGNVTGSTGSVLGAVASVTGAVGSVTGAVGSVAGNVDGSVASVTAAVTTGTISAGAITAAAIATDAIDADALATDAVNEIRDAILPTQNVAFSNIEFLFVAASDHATPVTGASGTAVTRSIDGGNFGAGTGTLAEVGNGIYQYDASQADMNGGIITFRFTGTGGTPGAPDDRFLTIVTGGGV